MLLFVYNFPLVVFIGESKLSLKYYLIRTKNIEDTIEVKAIQLENIHKKYENNNNSQRCMSIVAFRESCKQHLRTKPLSLSSKITDQDTWYPQPSQITLCNECYSYNRIQGYRFVFATV